MNLRNYILFAALIVLVSCKRDGNSPGRVFIPDMMYSPAYEPYAESKYFEDGMAARLPVEGTIPRGHMEYHIPNSDSGYALSTNYMSAIEISDASIAKGKKLYGIYCAICHGAKGEADGEIIENGKFPLVPPAYSSATSMAMTPGNIFHRITYGKGMMGSYASQLRPNERWEVVHYILSLQKRVDDFRSVSSNGDDNSSDEDKVENS